MNTHEITRKRAILLTTRLRFSPQIQPTKEAALDKIIEQILSVADSERGLTRQEIRHILSSESGSYAIGPSDIKNSLERLNQEERVVFEQEGDSELYRLSEETRLEVEDVKRQAEARFDSVVNRLFKDAKEGPPAYTNPFLECLCLVFSYLGEEYVQVIKGSIKGGEFPSILSFFAALEKTKKDFDSIDHSLFKDAITTFFQDSNPDYDAIKWNMVQNYYLTKALGLDPEGHILSEELFRDAVFYLDTNIIISALEPKEKDHEAFLILNKAWKQLGIKLKACQISLDELSGWLAYQRRLIQKVVGQIPDDTAPTIQSPFFQIYWDKIKSGETVNFDELFTNFDSPKQDLRSRFDVELEDDVWFDEARSKSEVRRFSEALISKYESIRRYPKLEKAALHDAMLILWVQKLREETGGNIWVVTLDTSLRGSIPQTKRAHPHSLAITLDAVLQWISPMVVRESEENDFATIFGKMIRSRFLPQETFFDLDDFLVFEEIGMSCRGLPGEDVEECIRYIRANAPTLDPTNPADREKLAHEISKFFIAPERKYKRELENLEKKLKQRDKKIEELEKESLRRSACLRVGFIAIVFLMIEAVVVYLASHYGEGPNLFQKVLKSRPLLSIGPVIAILLGWVILGKKRLEALGWPFTKIFKHE